MSRAEATMGLAPHSGWAAVVILGGEVARPEVLFRGRIEMADPRLAGSKQPYHQVESLPLSTAEKRLKRLRESAGAMADEAIRTLFGDLSGAGQRLAVAGILESSGRKASSLASILASHALIHTADGDHFRDALEGACRRCGLGVVRVRQRDLVVRAAAGLGRSPEELAVAVRELGRTIGPPWGADQKSAALLAWLLLEEGRRAARR